MPDVTVDGWGGVEAKAIHASDRDNAMWEKMRAEGRDGGIGEPHVLEEPFFRKLDEQVERALDQWAARGGKAAGRLIIFAHILQFDTEVFVTSDDWLRIEQVAQSVSEAHECRVVVAYNFNWCLPRIDVGE